MGRTNYSRWCSVYFQDMLSLSKRAPEVFDAFKRGRFTVKRFDSSFTSVSTDQALEQSINKDSKSQGGIIGITKKKNPLSHGK